MAEGGDKRGYTPKGGRLPAKPLADAQEVARALADLAGPSSKQMIASQVGASIGGAFNARFSSANYYGLIKRESDAYHLTSRGEGVLAGNAKDKCAAVMGTGFGPVIRKFSTRPVNKDAIKQRLKNDCQAADGALDNLAEVLIASCGDAGLIVDGRFDAAAIESVGEDEVGPQVQTPGKQPKTTNGSGAGSKSRASRSSYASTGAKIHLHPS